MKGQVLIDRIRDKMAVAKNDYVSMMGKLMTAYLRIHPDTEIDGAILRIMRTLRGVDGGPICRSCVR